MSQPFYRMPDSELRGWSASFSESLSASAAELDVTPRQAADYAALQAAFAESLARWTDNATRTPIAMERKRADRLALIAGTRFVVAMVNNNPATTDGQREMLGIKARKRPATVPPPAESPTPVVEHTRDRKVTLQFASGGRSGRRARPSGAKGAGVFVHLGPDAPVRPEDWTFERLVTKPRFTLDLERRTVADTLWLCAYWYNARGQPGRTGRPIRVNLPAPMVLPNAGLMNVAA